MFFGKQNSDKETITPPEPFHSRQFVVYGRDVRWLIHKGDYLLESGDYRAKLTGEETFEEIKEIVLEWISTG